MFYQCFRSIHGTKTTMGREAVLAATLPNCQVQVHCLISLSKTDKNSEILEWLFFYYLHKCLGKAKFTFQLSYACQKSSVQFKMGQIIVKTRIIRDIEVITVEGPSDRSTFFLSQQEHERRFLRLSTMPYRIHSRL